MTWRAFYRSFSDMNPKTGECTREGMARLELAFSRIPPEERHAYDHALKLAPDLVKTEPPTVSFLRKAEFDYDSAARSIVQFWHKRRELYGEQDFTKPIHTLGNYSIAALKTSFFMVLPPNAKGRSIVLLEQQKLSPECHISLREQLKCVFYVLVTLVKDASIKHKLGGEIDFLVRFNLDNMSSTTENPEFVRLALSLAHESIPVRVVGVHLVFCPTSNSRQAFDSTAIATVLKNLGDYKHILGGVYVCRSEEEIAEKLSALHLVRESLPLSMGGVWDASSYLEKFNQSITDSEGDNGSSDRASTSVEETNDTSFEEAAEALASLASAALPLKKSSKRKAVAGKGGPGKLSKKSAKDSPSRDIGKPDTSRQTIGRSKSSKPSVVDSKSIGAAATKLAANPRMRPEPTTTAKSQRFPDSSMASIPVQVGAYDAVKAASQVEELKRQYEATGDLQSLLDGVKEIDTKMKATVNAPGGGAQTFVTLAAVHMEPLLAGLSALAASRDPTARTFIPSRPQGALEDQQKPPAIPSSEHGALLHRLQLLTQLSQDGPVFVSQDATNLAEQQSGNQQMILSLLLNKLSQTNQPEILQLPREPQMTQLGLQSQAQNVSAPLLSLLQKLHSPNQQPNSENMFSGSSNGGAPSQLQQILPILQKLQAMKKEAILTNGSMPRSTEYANVPNRESNDLFLQSLLGASEPVGPRSALEQHSTSGAALGARELKILELLQNAQSHQASQNASTDHDRVTSAGLLDRLNQVGALSLVQRQLALQQQSRQVSEAPAQSVDAAPSPEQLLALLKGMHGGQNQQPAAPPMAPEREHLLELLRNLQAQRSAAPAVSEATSSLPALAAASSPELLPAPLDQLRALLLMQVQQQQQQQPQQQQPHQQSPQQQPIRQQSLQQMQVPPPHRNGEPVPSRETLLQELLSQQLQQHHQQQQQQQQRRAAEAREGVPPHHHHPTGFPSSWPSGTAPEAPPSLPPQQSQLLLPALLQLLGQAPPP